MIDPSKLDAGTLLAGRYRLKEVLGAREKGWVWEAIDEVLDGVRVALRPIPAELVRDEPGYQQLRVHARIASMLKHPGLIPQTAHLNEDPPFIVSELVIENHMVGRSLQAEMRTADPYPVSHALLLVDELLPIFELLESKGIAHGEVTPSNVMARSRLRGACTAAALTRWRLRCADAAPPRGLGYLSPEHVRGDPLDARSDVYSLAATVHAMLLGRPPFAGGNAAWAIRYEPVSPMDGVPGGVAKVLGSALAKDPDERPRSARELHARLRAAAAESERAPRTGSQAAPLAEVRLEPPPARSFAWLARLDDEPGPEPAAVAPPAPGFLDRLLRRAPPGPLREVVIGEQRVALEVGRQIIWLEIPAIEKGSEELSIEVPVYAAKSFLSASVLAQKAKQFDDGLYAAVELAAHRGCGRVAGKAALLRAIGARLAAGPRAHPAALVPLAAAQLGGVEVPLAGELAGQVDAMVNAFLQNEIRSKPLGFYTWSADLEAIFRQDRMLQTELKDDGIRELAEVLSADAASRESYEQVLDLAARLTNPFARADLRPFVAAAAAGAPLPSTRPVSFAPPSIARETELAKQLFPDGAMPDGFSLMDALVAHVRSGELSLEPGPGSGWYAHQTWALELLLRPEAMPEAARLALGERYRDQLEELFRGLLTLTRETHVKQLEVLSVTGMGMPRSRPAIVVAPGLTVEPLPAHYARRAASYRFVREVLEDAFGPGALDGMRRLSAAGPMPVDLGSELRGMERLFAGAHALSCKELGAAPETELASSSAISTLEGWRKDLEHDPDLAQDCRAMVPLAHDPRTGQTRVWAFLGWSTRPVTVAYEVPPKPVGDARVTFADETHAIVYPVSAEMLVPRLLNRAEFRSLCDEGGTIAAIREAVARLSASART